MLERLRQGSNSIFVVMMRKVSFIIKEKMISSWTIAVLIHTICKDEIRSERSGQQSNPQVDSTSILV